MQTTILGLHNDHKTYFMSLSDIEGRDIMNDNIKQVIVIRKDLNMKKGHMAAQVANASMQFLINNNESKRGDEIFVKLTGSEAMWLTGSFAKSIVSVDSEDALQELVFRAELEGVEVHPITESDEEDEDSISTITCAAFGPCDAAILDRLTGNLRIV